MITMKVKMMNVIIQIILIQKMQVIKNFKKIK